MPGERCRGHHRDHHAGHCHGCGAPIWMEEEGPGHMMWESPGRRGFGGRQRRITREEERAGLRERLDELKSELEAIETRLQEVEG